jgi:hypothetical protein
LTANVARASNADGRAMNPSPTASPPTIPEKISPADAVALSRGLLAALDDERKLESGVKRAGRKLRDTSEALRVAWEAAVRAAIASDRGASARRADTDEDAVWLALHAWLKGWSLLPPELAPEAEAARTTLAALFPNGPGFTDLTYALEWAEADRLLALLDAGGHVARIEALGGAALLRALRAAHRRYEEVLGIRRAAGGDTAGMNAAFAPLVDDFLGALRDYVAAAHPSGDPVEAARNEALLAPLRNWSAENALRAQQG